MNQWLMTGFSFLAEITFVMLVVTYLSAMRYNLHMFQLNGYKNDEFRNWLRKNERRQRMRYPLVIFVLLTLACFYIFQKRWGVLGVELVLCLYLIPVNAAYNIYRKHDVKKKLVYTARVKRQIFTNVLLAVLLCAVMLWVGGKQRHVTLFANNCDTMMPLVCVMTLYVFLQPWIMQLVNLINHPVEAAITNYYIRDAIHKLHRQKNLKIIGITGSYGKTSMKYYLNTLLEDFYNVLITPGNFNTTLGVVRTIREHLKPSHEIFLCEMGARRVNDIKEICDLVHPDAGIITSIGPQHLETFHSIDHIIDTKYELADALPKGGKIFLNGDNDYIRGNADKYRSDRSVIFYTNEQGEGYHASDIRLSNLGTEFTVTAPDGESARFAMRLIGGHNVINVCGAIAVAHEMGIPLEKLRVPVRRIEPVEHRLQMIQRGNVTIIDDAYNSNPVGSKAAVETLHMFDGLRILVTPGMVELGDKEDEYNYKFGTYAAANCDYIALVGRRAHTDPIRNGALDSGFPEKKLRSFDDLQGALEWAYQRTEEGHKYILLENDLPDNY
jgi:UDP-N-acetylmuramoyl-tripeptide--D-alanyl-D-alanine ligase